MANKNPVLSKEFLDNKIKKGEVRNPQGKTGNRSITDYLRRFADSDEITYHIIQEKDGKRKEMKGRVKGADNQTIGQLIAAQLLNEAVKGNLQAISMIQDRLEGKPKQRIEQDLDVSQGLVMLPKRQIIDIEAKNLDRTK